MVETKRNAHLHAMDVARATLRGQLTRPGGSTIYCVLRRRSASGVRRHISLFAIGERYGIPAIIDITKLAGRAINGRVDPKTNGLVVDGVGTDMSLAIVHELSVALYGDVTTLKREWL